jgi:hypothetical protein
MIGTKQKPHWRVVCRQPEKGEIVANLVYGNSRRAHGTANDSHELETLRRQAEFLNQRSATPSATCRADGRRRDHFSPGERELFPGHPYAPKPTK